MAIQLTGNEAILPHLWLKCSHGPRPKELLIQDGCHLLHSPLIYISWADHTDSIYINISVVITRERWRDSTIHEIRHLFCHAITTGHRVRFVDGLPGASLPPEPDALHKSLTFYLFIGVLFLWRRGCIGTSSIELTAIHSSSVLCLLSHYFLFSWCGD